MRDAIDHSGLRKPRRDACRTLRPVDYFVAPRDRPEEEDPPLLRVRRRKSNAAKRNAEQRDVAARRAPGIGSPHGVPGQIPARAFGIRAIGLNAGRVHLKSIGMLQVTKGIEMHRNRVVVVRQQVASDQMGPDTVRLAIEALEEDIHVIGVVSDVHDGPFADRLSVVREPVHEAFDARHLVRRVAAVHHAGTSSIEYRAHRHALANLAVCVRRIEPAPEREGRRPRR